MIFTCETRFRIANPMPSEISPQILRWVPDGYDPDSNDNKLAFDTSLEEWAQVFDALVNASTYGDLESALGTVMLTGACYLGFPKYDGNGRMRMGVYNASGRFGMDDVGHEVFAPRLRSTRVSMVGTIGTRGSAVVGHPRDKPNAAHTIIDLFEPKTSREHNPRVIGHEVGRSPDDVLGDLGSAVKVAAAQRVAGWVGDMNPSWLPYLRRFNPVLQ